MWQHEDFFHLLVESHILCSSYGILEYRKNWWCNTSGYLSPLLYGCYHSKSEEIYLCLHVMLWWKSLSISCTFEATEQSDANSKQNKEQPDRVHAHTKEVLSFGLLYKQLVDAVRQGDGLHVLQWWKFMLLIFKATMQQKKIIVSKCLLSKFSTITQSMRITPISI